MTTASDIAHEVYTALSETRQISPFSRRVEGFDLPMAYAAAAELRVLRGEPVTGRKIGFTNRTIWQRYGVDAPMWGDMDDKSVITLGEEPVDLSPFLEPRLEPEVALKLGASPRADMGEAQLLATVEWIAPAFEVVQSIYPGWRFSLADCAAAGGLHGCLLVGPKRPVGSWAEAMGDITCELYKDGSLVEIGHGRNVLDGPLQALRYLVETLLADGSPPLVPGEIVTTGTLTDAQPLHPGDHFEARYANAPLGSIAVRFI